MSRPAFGFVIIRHVDSEITNKYWKKSYECIRKFYSDPIMIVDDNSNPDFPYQYVKSDYFVVGDAKADDAHRICGQYKLFLLDSTNFTLDYVESPCVISSARPDSFNSTFTKRITGTWSIQGLDIVVGDILAGT